jgi:hypothetical protein
MGDLDACPSSVQYSFGPPMWTQCGMWSGVGGTAVRRVVVAAACGRCDLDGFAWFRWVKTVSNHLKNNNCGFDGVLR